MSQPAPRDLDVIFRPRSIAVIGASSRRGSIGREIVHNLVDFDFQGKLFPVNPTTEFIHSIKSYPSVMDIPDSVDLAIVVVRASLVIPVAKECGKKGVRGLIVITAGFKEIGDEGAARERELLEICREHGMRLVGPNCMGVFNGDPRVNLNATFAPGAPLPGSIGFVSQSGALGIAVWTEMQRRRLGLSQFVSVGNKPDIAGNDLLEYWQHDPDTNLIAMYIESLGNPRRFTQLARKITRTKPILMVKSGRTSAGQRAATSHTGALSGLDEATDALLRQTGVIRARTIDDMMALMQAFTKCKPPERDRVAVLTNAGGPGIMAADALSGYGMQVVELSQDTRQKLEALLPSEASVRNPVDMVAGATHESFGACLSVLLDAPEVDIIICAFVPPIMVNPTDVLRAISDAWRGHDKPVLMVLMAEDRHFDEIPQQLPDCPPLYRYPETAAYAAAEMVNWANRGAQQRRQDSDVRSGPFGGAEHLARTRISRGIPRRGTDVSLARSVWFSVGPMALCLECRRSQASRHGHRVSGCGQAWRFGAQVGCRCGRARHQDAARTGRCARAPAEGRPVFQPRRDELCRTSDGSR